MSVVDKDYHCLLALQPMMSDIVANGASGSWASKDGLITTFQDNAWIFYQPRTCWLAWIADTPVPVTANDSAFTGGKVRITIHFMLCKAPAS